MKKILLALVISLVFISCEKKGDDTPYETTEPYLRFYQSKLVIPPFVSGSADLIVESNIDWQVSVTSGADWLQLSKNSGHGKDTIRVSVDQNTSGQARTATITAMVINPALNLQAQLTVEQKPYTVQLLSQKSLNGKLNNHFNAMAPALDGGYLCVGSNNFTGFPGSGGFGDAWMVKFNKNGDTVWTRTMGGPSDDDVANAAIPTLDGGFIVGATSFSYKNPAKPGWWIIKLKSNGDTAWTRVIGSRDHYEYITSMAPALNGDFIVGGTKYTPVGNVLITKFDRNGNTIWEKYLDEFTGGHTTSVSVALDGSVFVSVGTSGSDYGIIKLNASGEKIWSKILGSNKTDVPESIQSTIDGGCIVVGTSDGSENGDVTGKNHSSYTDLWVVKLNASGNITWNKLLGGSSIDLYNRNAGIALTLDGGYVFAGISNSPDGDVDATQSRLSTWLFKLNNSGRLLWSKPFGEPAGNQARALLMNPDGSFWVAGSAYVFSGNPSQDQSDGWLMKFKDN